MRFLNQLLIATPQMDDEYFRQAVVLICEQNQHGLMGLVLNQPTDLSLAELVAKINFMMSGDITYPENQVMAGGPVSVERGFILHTPVEKQFLHSYKINPNLWLTTSADVLDTLATDSAPEKCLVGLGCATWEVGQLEQEIAQNMWLVTDYDERIVFDVPYDQCWKEATKLLGFESHQLQTKAGYC